MEDRTDFIIKVVKECRKDPTLLPDIVKYISLCHEEDLKEKDKIISDISFLASFLFWDNKKKLLMKYKDNMKFLLPSLLYYFRGSQLGKEIQKFIDENYKA